MANKNKAKYIALLVLFTVIFLIGMLICFILLSEASMNRKYSSLKGRLEAIEREESMYGPDNIYSNLYFDDDYEKEFDSYWEYANVYREYVKGRFADNPEESLEILKNYAENCSDKERKAAVLEYISIIENR